MNSFPLTLIQATLMGLNGSHKKKKRHKNRRTYWEEKGVQQECGEDGGKEE